MVVCVETKVAKKVKNAGDQAIRKVKKGKMLEEFKAFIARGNVLDLAVGVIIGGAFQNLVTSLTDHLISPILGCFTEVDFNAYTLKIGNLDLQYGAFLTDVINFVIMAFIVFLIVKFMNRFFVRKEVMEEVVVSKEEELPRDIQLLEEIRDLLKEKKDGK